MRVKVDENLPIDVAGVLRDAGYETDTVLDEALGGTSDVRLAAICQEEGRVLFTLDGDFGDIRTYPPADYPGIVILRPATQSIPDIVALVRRLLPILATEFSPGHLWVVTNDRVRIRGA